MLPRRFQMLPRRLLAPIGWVVLALINTGLYRYTGSLASALLAIMTASVGLALLAVILRDLL